MGDAFFNCGLWLGEATSASRFFVVLDEVEARLSPAEREDWQREVVAPIRQQLWDLTWREGAGESDDTQRCLDLGLDLAAALVHPLRRYVDDRLRGTYDGDPCALEVWELPHGVEDVDTVWCAIDLLKGCARSAERRLPVRVYFDSLDSFTYRWP
jgi:hypothetical protein